MALTDRLEFVQTISKTITSFTMSVCAMFGLGFVSQSFWKPVQVVIERIEIPASLEERGYKSEIVVKRELVRAEKLGFWAWFLGAWGIGTYKRNDEVDIRYKRDGVTKVAHDVPYEGASTSGQG